MALPWEPMPWLLRQISTHEEDALCSNADRLADFGVEADESTLAWLELLVDLPSQDR
jgi:hypothetical protein